ncbi:MAG: glycosyl hydrolase-related protein [Gloeomargarita sp. SKYG116]|nr:glycosyl hydrolase-related protein [Gloeomargarita sp. SKYG116]MDW8400621.1 glycoside hydrolase family 38 C-terminal domain-containing protein [Gloeomargarita sp. SKYGB_i_bin116]
MTFAEQMTHLLQSIQHLAYPAILPLSEWQIAAEGSENLWQTVTIPATWGGYDQTIWWQRHITLPPAWRSPKIALRMDIPEGLVFLNHQPYCGIDTHHQEVLLPPGLEPELYIQIQAYSGRKPEPNQCQFSELVTIDPVAEKLYTWLEHLWSVSESNDWIKASLLRWIDTIDDTEIDMAKWLETLQDFLRAHTVAPATPHIHLIGHSHIDVVWLWTHQETRRKVGRTFSTALHLMREFPEFCFCQSQAQLYAYCKQDYPELYRQIQNQVQAGRWQVEGAVWVEPDGNLISGESWVRQLVYGQRFFQQEFGVTCRVLWLPDTFGYQGNLPQLLKQAGIDYFFTTKLNWNDTQEFPYDSFWWQGIDGTRVLAHQPPVGLEGLLGIPDLEKTGQHYTQREVAPVVLQTFGYGDGGGGVTRQHLHLYALVQPLRFPFPSHISSPLAFFQNLAKYGENLPVWQGELYLEKHRGTYTTHSRVKQLHRQAEREFYITELLATYAWLQGYSYPEAQLEQSWRLLLLQQFHDILPGTFISDAYPQILTDFEQILANLWTLRQDMVNCWQSGPITPGVWTIWNSIHALDNAYIVLPIPRSVVESSENPLILQVNGQVIPHQILTDESSIPSLYPEHHVPECVHILGQIPHLPAHSFTEIHLAPASTTAGLSLSPYSPHLQHLENECLRLTLDANGNLQELWDKRLQRNLLAANQLGAEIKLFLDRPQQWEAWDIDADYAQHESPPLELTNAQVIEQGVLRQGIAFHYEVQRENGLHCRIKKSLYLYREAPFVECFIEVDLTCNSYAPWIMKLLFPLALVCEQATFDIPFGMIQRHTGNPAQFEVPALTWADLSNSDWGVSIVSRDKYGFSVSRNQIGLTLLRVAHYPHPQEPWHLTDTAITDTGVHQFCCRLYPHPGTVQAAAIAHQAREFLYPPLPFPGRLAARMTPLVTIDAANLILATVKKATDARGIVLRIYEAYGQPTSAMIAPQIPAQAIWECDLHEQPRHCLSQGTPFRLDFSPFGVKTLLLIPG